MPHHSALSLPASEVPNPPLGPALARHMAKGQMLSAVQSKEGVHKQHHRAMSQQHGAVSLVSVRNYPASTVVGGSSLVGFFSSSLYSQEENHHAENHTFLFPRY